MVSRYKIKDKCTVKVGGGKNPYPINLWPIFYIELNESKGTIVVKNSITDCTHTFGEFNEEMSVSKSEIAKIKIGKQFMKINDKI